MSFIEGIYNLYNEINIMNILKTSQVKKEDIEIVENIPCPFCKEDDFDLIGLKIHLESGWCEKYNSIDVNKRFDRF